MSFWSKRISSVADASLPQKMDEALQEEKNLWRSQDNFIDPCAVKDFQDKWSSIYCSARKKTGGILFAMGLSGKKFRKLAPQFIEVYEKLPSKAQAFNEWLADKKAAEAAKLVLPVEGRMLDDQQMRCITKEVRNHLVLAGAGSGKTTTIVGYVKYLLTKKICMPDEILVLSFTRASATEMSERLNKEIGEPITAKTFHSLGVDIITAVQGKKPKIYSADIQGFVREQLDTLTQDPSYLEKLCVYLTYNETEQKTEFDFQSEQEYRSYLEYNPPVTLKKEKVKSYGELDIANFLTQNGITYVYEQEYPIDTRTSEFGQYYPDFYLPNFDLYIEYFGIDRQGNVPPYFSEKNGMSATQTYQEGIMWKRELHRKNGTRMIEVYAYEKFEEQLLPKLKERLKRAGVVLAPISPEDMWADINEFEEQKINRVNELFGTVITLTKSNNFSLDEIRSRNHSHQSLPSIDAVIDLIEPVYNSYQAMLKSQNEIDFNDMINLASAYVQEGKFLHPYSYVIVDEYQDISPARYRLLETMRQQKDYRLFCVGDDWQSIYRFSGSDIRFILDFEKYWGASEISRIETTYRFPQSLISISGNFIMKNPKQKQKKLRSAIEDHSFSMGKIIGYTESHAVKLMAEQLKELPKGCSVLFLGRYKGDIKVLKSQSQLFSYQFDNEQKQMGKKENTKVSFAGRPDLQISFMTAHGSKGLQADYVFVLNTKAYGMGFPSQIEDAPILQLLLDNSDPYPFAEERRLFYVAITRAKKKVWLVTLKGNESVFVKEIDDAHGKDMLKAQYTCPWCGGQLVRRNGPHGGFFGCSNYKSNRCRYTRVIGKSKTKQTGK